VRSWHNGSGVRIGSPVFEMGSKKSTRPNFSQPFGCNRVSHTISRTCLDRRLRRISIRLHPAHCDKPKDLSQSTRFRYEVCEKPGLASSGMGPSHYTKPRASSSFCIFWHTFRLKVHLARGTFAVALMSLSLQPKEEVLRRARLSLGTDGDGVYQNRGGQGVRSPIDSL